MIKDLTEVLTEALQANVSAGWPEGVARKAIAHLSASGYVIVPREPTEAMLDAGAVAEGDGNLERQALNIWHAMLSALPDKEG